MLWIAALLLFSRRRLYVYQFNGKYQGGIRLDLTGLTSTIGQLLGNIKLPFAAHRHHRKGLGPSFDDLIATESGGLRIALIAAVKLRSEEHTSELQSRQYLVCRLLLEK